MIKKSHRVALYLRVSTDGQTTANQEHELRAVAERKGCEIVRVYRDHGISGAKGRDKRPQFDAMHRDAARREFDVIMAWSVDRLGRSLQDLIARRRSTPPASICICISRGSIRRRQPEKPCSGCSVSSVNLNAP
jgi:hypothetical protein